MPSATAWLFAAHALDAGRRGIDANELLDRHPAVHAWVGPGCGWKSTRPGVNGVVELSPFDFLDRLSDLVPPPRKHQHRYHGVFAPNHKLRGEAFPLQCPSCGGDIRLIAFITEPGPIRKI